MPSIAPHITVSASDYVDVAIPTNTISISDFFHDRNGYITPTEDAQIVPGRFYEVGHDDFLFRTAELDVSLKELMNRIYKLELDVYELKQQLRGDIKL